MVLRIKLAVGLSADRALGLVPTGRFPAGAVFAFGAGAAVYRAFSGVRTVAVGRPFTVSVPVVDRHGHFCGIAGLVGNYDLLSAVCRSKAEAVAFVKLDRRAVYGNGIYILLGNCNRPCSTIGLAVFYAADDRLHIIKRQAVGTKIGYVQARVNKHYINNILSVGFYAERLLVPAEYERLKLCLGEILIGHQIGDKYGSAVVGCVYRYLLRILKEQAGGELI